MTAAASAAARHRMSLPHGTWRGGEHLRRAVLRPVTGADEEALLEAGGLPAERVSLLLGRCVLALEEGAEGGGGGDAGASGIGTEAARGLVAGDRAALLLHLRRLTFGERMEAVLDCPAPACGERMELELATTDLLLAPYPDPRPEYELAAAGRPLRFRLPDGGDQAAAAARLLEAGAEAAVELLARRCLLDAGSEDPPAPLSAAQVARLSTAAADRDPQAELLLDLTCPGCDGRFSSRFDPGSFLLAEMAGDGGGLYRQVHALALHYHWSEADVLALTPRKRRLYLDLLADAAGAARGGGDLGALRVGAA